MAVKKYLSKQQYAAEMQKLIYPVGGAFVGSMTPGIIKNVTPGSWLETVWPDAPAELKPNETFGSLVAGAVALATAGLVQDLRYRTVLMGYGVGAIGAGIGRAMAPTYFLRAQGGAASPRLRVSPRRTPLRLNQRARPPRQPLNRLPVRRVTSNGGRAAQLARRTVMTPGHITPTYTSYNRIIS